MSFPESGFNTDKHNWLYSVVPSFNGKSNANGPGIYLAGYCKNCQNAFTVRLPEDAKVGHVRLQNLDIPLEGCAPKSPTTA